ncbi:outer membrane protein [Ruegeria sp. HKCCA5763]|uniref:outer membrane protein n=1 Tax=Ruegeria sp. HKCCA5763 TaxID=2682987 RepID=UPI0014891BCF|nr:porin family protein [Ruegeria sp. HKCCA5763]
MNSRRNFNIWTLPVSTAALLAAGPALSQQNDWKFAASIYLFAPETTVGATTPLGPVEGKLSFSDAISNLDFAFMGAFEARNGRWGFIADYMLNDLSFGNSTPGPAFSGLNTSLKTQILSGYAAYRVSETPDVQVDLAAGFRWFDTKSTFTLLPGGLPGGTTTLEDNWVDPVVGARIGFTISERWSGTVFADYGGFSSTSETWQALLTANYALSDRWDLRIGYRYLSVDHDINGNDFSFKQSGPIFGATYRF